jgi:hypothetical protein
MSVALVRVGQLGALERAVELLEDGIQHLFEAANTRKAVTRSRRSLHGDGRVRKVRLTRKGRLKS